jgi:putative DNA primase/helicase
MNVQEAIDQACATVGIKPPRSYQIGRWAKTDTLSGKNGKGDGRIIVDELKVVGWNHQTGEHLTVWLKDDATPAERKQIAERREKDDQERRQKAARAARIASHLVEVAKQAPHPYFVRKGFPNELGLIVAAADVAAIGGEYLVAGQSAIVMPARIGSRITSAQLIWEDGTKKFLFGGETGGASHRVATGAETWLCEGYATGLSLRAALKALSRQATILCCFSASNVLSVSRSVQGRCFIAADNDKPLDQFGGRGTGEHYAEASGKPFLMPHRVGTDFNDMHMADGIFAVQRAISTFLRTQR